MGRLHPSQTPSWDVALTHYKENQHAATKPNHADPPHKPSVEDCAGTCLKLYQEFFNRQNKLAETKKLQLEAETRRKRSQDAQLITKIADQQNELHALKAQEHKTLSQLLASMRELESDRASLGQSCSRRLHPPLESLSATQSILMNALARLGDERRNAEAINSLLYPDNPETVTEFIHSVEVLRDHQQRILAEFGKMSTYEAQTEDLMTMEVIDRLETTIAQLEKEGALDLASLKKEDQLIKMVDLGFSRLVENGIEDELKKQRREFRVEMNYLTLQVIQDALKLDIQWRALMAKHRITKFHVRGYNSNAVEDMKESKLFQDVGSSTSLRNKMRISQSATRILQRACNVLLGKEPRPQLHV